MKIKKVLSITLVIGLLLSSISIGSSDKTFSKAIEYVINKNYMSATNNDFKPTQFVTRQELAQVIYNVKIRELDWMNTTANIMNNTVVLSAGDNFASGVLLDSNYVLSCYHFYADSGIVTIMHGNNIYLGKIVALDKTRDVCLIEINEPIENINTVKLASDTTLSEEIITIGNPMDSPFSVSKGIISNKSFVNKNIKYLQFDMALNSGNSGGGVFNINGELVSIILSKINDKVGYGLSFGAPIDDLKEFLDKNYYNIVRR